MEGTRYYEPTTHGHEAEVLARMRTRNETETDMKPERDNTPGTTTRPEEAR
jgi:hypothetical protein